MFAALIVMILASLGVLALVAKAATGDQLPNNKLATFLTCAALLGLLAAMLLMRGKWFLAVPAAVGAAACAMQYNRLSAMGRRNNQTLPPRSDMTSAEALAVLGLQAGASADEVRAAHRKLIEQVHPDKGGNDYLAAQINTARDVLLKDLP